MQAENTNQAERKTLDERHKMSDLERLRHSCAHVMANAILRLWPDAQFAAGPPVENGFYYDVELQHRISPEDFPAIEAEMKKIVKENQVFEKVVVTRDQAIKDAQSGRLGALGERPAPSKFKLGNLEDIPEGEPISYFKSGDFIDLCAGPHVMRTGNIGAFKLTSVASAYYKGNEKNPQLQRIYGTAFKNKTEMEAYFKMLEEAKRRDHRKIGAEMSLFAMDPEYTGPGLALWLPKGAAIAEELEKLAKETEFLAGYVRVKTPHLAKEKMYLTSGHLPLLYADSMFPPMELKESADAQVAERYYLKAMNCPHHHRIFAAEPRSYRDLPLRLAEYGTCYRYEQSGELFGLMRVRSLNMNDAHIYCTPEQFSQEFNAVNEMYIKYFKIFGIEKYVMRFSTHDPAKLGQKFVNEPELWKQTEDLVRQVLIDSKINYIEVPNEAAFYGPKIDVQVWSVIGREFTLATNQVDFAVPKRFGLTYRDRDNTEKTPLCIHRAPLGTHERFIGFLIEHYAGNFPLWLAPEQVRVLTVGDEEPLVNYAKGIVQELRANLVRAEGDFSNDKINGKILQ
ncbi:MAG TPA: threonine--tRNA ligase, partial [Candidatus Sulfotelmatobacter sp.]|nr:threonine--tRNA ligase [Candidatus Sulfotelmatobacter sp.]